MYNSNPYPGYTAYQYYQQPTTPYYPPYASPSTTFYPGATPIPQTTPTPVTKIMYYFLGDLINFFLKGTRKKEGFFNCCQ